MHQKFSKRSLLVGAGSVGLASIVARPSLSQVDSVPLSIELNYDGMVQFHSQHVYDAQEFIVRGDVFSRESLFLGLERLSDLELLTPEEIDAILELIDTILNSSSIGEALAKILAILDAILDSLGDVGKGIAAIVRSSVETAQELLRAIEYDDIKIAIAHDVRGALDGAVAGVSLLSILPGGRVAAALIGLSCGAVSASIIGHYRPETA